MLLWAGLLALVLGIAAFAVDRRAGHVFHDRIPARWFRRIRRTTDYAKGARWLAISIALIAAAWLARRTLGDGPTGRLAFRASLAFLASLAGVVAGRAGWRVRRRCARGRGGRGVLAAMARRGGWCSARLWLSWQAWR